jgi:2,5-diketo-D-gluconate reductase A
MPAVPTVTLANGVEMPVLGLGTWPMDDAEAEAAVATALAAGYRLVDTAENYGNEVGVGRGLRASGVDRDEMFVTTKFNRRWHHREGPAQVAAASLERLGLDVIDLLLIHWPNPDQDRYVDAWRGMLELLDDGVVRAVGVSNFKPAHLARLVDETGVAPHVNQIQLEPRAARADEQAFNRGLGIVVQSWSPLGKGGALLRDPVIVDVAAHHGRSPAQVVIRWHLQSGLVTIPKSQDPTRIRENLDVFDFALSEADMAAIDGLDGGDVRVADSDRTGH